MVPRRAATLTHDHKRNGTTDLFAAMDVATGEALYDCHRGHTAADVLRFGLNLIERWFKELTDRRVRHGVFTAVAELETAIETRAEHWNDNPKPFVWHFPAQQTIDKVRRGRAAPVPNPRRTIGLTRLPT